MAKTSERPRGRAAPGPAPARNPASWEAPAGPARPGSPPAGPGAPCCRAGRRGAAGRAGRGPGGLRRALGAAGLLLAAGVAGPPAQGAAPGLGQALAPEEAQSLTVYPDGRGLPPGRGSVAQGAALYALHCAACHGAQGQGAAEGLNGGRLVGRMPLVARPGAEKTVGNYWPHATTLFDYIRRAMPLQAPGSLTAEEVYALSAWLLHANGILPADAVLDAASLPAVRMPNREGFVRAAE